MAEVVDIAGLVRGREKRALTVRVVRKWTYQERNGLGDALYVGMVIADAQGNALYAEIPQEVIAKYDHLIDIGNVYTLKKIHVCGSRRTFKAIDRQLMIEFTEYTTIKLAIEYPPNIPRCVYNLTPFTAIVPAGQAVVNYTDAIGYIVKYEDLDSFVPRGREEVTNLRQVYIKDLSNNLMKVTLWGEVAINFSLDGVYNRDVGNVVVCLVVGCTPRQEYRGPAKVSLSASSTFAYYLNPQIQEAAPFYSRFKDVPIHIELPAQTSQPAPMAVPKTLKLMTIADLNAIKDPFEFEDGSSKCSITIASIPTNINWWYMSCKQHKNKANQQSDLTYTCPICNKPATHTRYSFSFVGRDDTGEARFFAYDDEAARMVGKDCEALMSPLGHARGLPQQMQNMIGKRYVVSVGLSTSTIRQYVVKAVLERPARRPAQPNTDVTMSQGQLSSSQMLHTDASMSQGQSSSSQMLPSPSQPMSALMLQSPQQSQTSIDGHDTSLAFVAKSPSAEAATARRNLFGRQAPTDGVLGDDAPLSDNDDAPCEDNESPVPKGKRKKPNGAKPAAKAGTRKTSTSDP